MGKLSGCFSRFPLLLKFLDVRTRLSVQVHPSDGYPMLIPTGDREGPKPGWCWRLGRRPVFSQV